MKKTIQKKVNIEIKEYSFQTLVYYKQLTNYTNLHTKIKVIKELSEEQCLPKRNLQCNTS